MQEQSLTGTLVVDVDFSPAAYFYKVVKPTTDIDGTQYSTDWGEHRYTLPVGTHTVAISYPWLFMRYCGKASVSIPVRPGETVNVRYRARFVRYLPGKISIL